MPSHLNGFQFIHRAVQRTILEQFITGEEMPAPDSHFPAADSQEPTVCESVLDVCHQRDHTVCPSVSAFLTEHLVLGVHPFWRECQGLSSWPSDALVWGGTTLRSPTLHGCMSGRVHLFLL